MAQTNLGMFSGDEEERKKVKAILSHELSELEKVRDRVLKILELHPPCRDDDKELIRLYELEFGEPKCYETISRSRRYWQAEGLFPSSKEAWKRRNEKQEEYKEVFRRGKG